ncbi:ABC-three component system middle component 1 [Pseudomonas fragi]|uniref:ABC-three component system middle component 1 n=1 Tax=Pseudomonas fragi TaxID=296 RepID=UPI0037FFCF89
MIIELIEEALIAHDFVKEAGADDTRFYKREVGAAIRFAILHTLDELCSPKELNAVINKSTPESFTGDPSFKKNCDLICIHYLKQLSEFKTHEEEIFAIEEDPYYFKKYVLYYSDAEEKVLQGQTYEEIHAAITSKELFNEYKMEPLAATQYSAAAKIFIKLPFLELPFIKRDLVPLRLQIEGAVSEAGLTNTYESMLRFSSPNVDDFIKEMISDEMANIQN